MRNWVKTTLFVSAFSPCLISVAVARVWDHGFGWDAIYYGLFGLLGTLTVRYILDAIRWNGETYQFSAKKIEANDALMLGVMVTYFIPFLGRAADLTVGAVLVILAVGAAALSLSSSILPSPVLRVLGYRFYKAETENGVVFTVISRRELLDPKHLTRVKRISNTMLVEVGSDS